MRLTRTDWIAMVVIVLTLLALSCWNRAEAGEPDLKLKCETLERVADLTLEVPNQVLYPGEYGEVYCMNYDPATGELVDGEPMVIRFLPEPSTGLMLLVGLPALAWLGRGR